MTPKIEICTPADRRPELPGKDVIHLWQCDLDALQDLESLQPALSPAEIARATRFVFQTDRDRYIAAKLWSRRILSCYLECPLPSLTFAVRPGGKPFIETKSGSPDLRFSLSRCGSSALLAVTVAYEIGVDIEQAFSEGDWQLLARFCLSPEEFEFVLSLPPRQRGTATTETWTRKEALAKAIGSGLTPEVLSMSIGPAAWEVREGPEGTFIWSLSGLHHPAAVAVKAN